MLSEPNGKACRICPRGRDAQAAGRHAAARLRPDNHSMRLLLPDDGQSRMVAETATNSD